MPTEADSPSKRGLGGRLSWLVGGAISGVIGSLIFGAVLWAVDPSIVIEVIPAMYGFEAGAATGWPFHVFHGLSFGIVFGFLVTREVVMGSIGAAVETESLASIGPTVRIGLAGLVYGLAIWAILPITVLPIWVSLTGVAAAEFPATAVESLVGHMLYGLVLGTLFSFFVETAPKAETAEAPFEEATESS